MSDVELFKEESLPAELRGELTTLTASQVDPMLPIRRFASYATYRDSGIPWLERLPDQWEVRRLRFCCRITEGQVPPDDDRFRDRTLIAPNHIESGSGRILSYETADEQGAISGKYLVRAGDLIYSKIRPALNKACIAKGEWLCSADMYPIAIATKDLLPTFLLYFVLSEPFVRLMVDDSMRVAMPKVNRETLANCPIAVPPVVEQRAIVSFLERETEKIDALLAKRERLIELLEARRIGVIARAVTKGLDPTVQLRESGVGGIGAIPRHWEIVRAKRVFTIFGGSTPDSDVPEYWDGSIPWATPEDLGNLRTKEIVRTRRSLTDAGYNSCRTTLVPPGSLVLSTRAPIGHVAISGVGLCTNQGCHSLVLRQNASSDFFYYQLLALSAELRSLGRGSTFAELGTDELGALRMTWPPASEQETIAAFLDTETARIEALVSNIREAIELLKGFRSGLISEAVTGRIDVRAETA